MGELGGFKKYVRKGENNIAVKQRVKNYKEFTNILPIIFPNLQEDYALHPVNKPVF